MFASVAALLCLAASTAWAQAPNTYASKYPDLQTMASNGTYFIVPVDDAALRELVQPYDLLPVPSDPALYPRGFPAGKHPLVVYSVYSSDIRQTIAGVPAYIERLTSTQITVPYVDRLADGRTPFCKIAKGFIGGADGGDLQGYVPVIVADLESAGGYPLDVAHVDPATRPWTDLGNGQLSVNVKQLVLPNPVSGPGVYPSAVDLLFSSTAATQDVTQAAVEAAMNQPIIFPTGQCEFNAYFFNETFAEPVARTGSVTLYRPAIPGPLVGTDAVEGAKTYAGAGVGGFSATCEQLAFPAEDCAAAAARVPDVRG